MIGFSVSRRRLGRMLLGALALPFTISGCARRRTSEEGVVDLSIQSDGDFLAFRPDELTCRTGEMIHLKFHHSGKFLSALHNWVLVMPDQMEAVDKDEKRRTAKYRRTIRVTSPGSRCAAKAKPS